MQGFFKLGRIDWGSRYKLDYVFRARFSRWYLIFIVLRGRVESWKYFREIDDKEDLYVVGDTL